MTYRATPFLWLLAITATIAFACSGGDDGTPTPTATADPGGTSAAPVATGPGTFILEGVRFDAPYDVEASGREVRVNGTTILSIGGMVPDAPDLDAPIESAFGLADHAAAAYEAAGGGPAALEAARDSIAGEPLLASAVVDAAAGELAITDTDGLEVFFIPEPADNAVRSLTDAEREAEVAAIAADWSEILANGGLILVPGVGPTTVATGGAAADLVAEIDAAMALNGAERAAALEALVGDADAANELIEHYEPAPQVRQRAPRERLAPRHQPIGLVSGDGAAGYGGTSAGPNQAQSGISQTPGNPIAYIFTTLPADSDARPFFRILRLEGYTLRVYQAEHRAFNGRGWENFRATSGAGALYLATHGAPRGVSVESFANQADARRVHERLNRSERGNFYWWREADGTWWLAISVQGLQRHWQSDNSIVHAAICNSNTLNAGFGAREYFSYQPVTSCAIAQPDTKLLWERLSGIQDEAKSRPASTAFSKGGFSAGFRHDDGSPNEDTVVSPGVVEFVAPTLDFGEEGIVVITFDAILDRTVPANSLVRLAGCAQPTADATYSLVGNFGEPAFGITIPVKANEAGETTVTVIAANTKSPGKIHLDGNQKPEGSNRVAQNRDDYINKFTCTNSAIPVTETPGIQPPTPSASPGTEDPPPVETPAAAEGATPVTDETSSVPAGKILTFYLGGVFYDAAGLVTIDAHLPFCSYRHTHGGPIAPVKPAGGASVSEHLGECGYGPPNFYLIDRP